MRGRTSEESLVAALVCLRDSLRSGRSLRQSLEAAASTDGSPLGPLVAELDAGRSLTDALDHAALRSSGGLCFALAGLSLQARGGGNPVPLVDEIVSRLRERVRAGREMQGASSQARLQARAVTWLTPGFLCLLTLMDPGGMFRSLTAPGGALVVGAGVVLQSLGWWWIRRIVSAPLVRPSRGRGFERLRSVPVLRAAVVASLRARERKILRARREDVAAAADLLALAIGAGTPPARCIEAASRSLPGEVGDALRDAARAIHAGRARSEVLRDAALRAGVEEAHSLARIVEAGHTLGVPVVTSLRALSAETRHALGAELAEDMRKASLKVLLPLALLILPAFVLACLVPVFLNGLRGMPL